MQELGAVKTALQSTVATGEDVRRPGRAEARRPAAHMGYW